MDGGLSSPPTNEGHSSVKGGGQWLVVLGCPGTCRGQRVAGWVLVEFFLPEGCPRDTAFPLRVTPLSGFGPRRMILKDRKGERLLGPQGAQK